MFSFNFSYINDGLVPISEYRVNFTSVRYQFQDIGSPGFLDLTRLVISRLSTTNINHLLTINNVACCHILD